MRRYSDITRNRYSDTVEVDPTTIGNPLAGNVFQGVWTQLRWMKLPDGTIYWSKSSEYLEIIDITGNTITPQLDWNGKFFRWTNGANGILTLPQTSTLSLPEGWRFTIYNDTDSYSISILTEGTDVLKSHNNVFFIPAESDSQMGKLIEGTPNQYYADIEQSLLAATGAVGQGNVGTHTSVTANIWTPLPIGLPVISDRMENVEHVGDGILRYNYAKHGTNGLYAKLFGTASLALDESTQTVDLSFSVNGVTISFTDVFKQTAKSGAGQTTGMYWPFAFKFEGFLNNGDDVRLVIRSSETTTVQCISASLQLSGGAFIGVNVT